MNYWNRNQRDESVRTMQEKINTLMIQIGRLEEVSKQDKFDDRSKLQDESCKTQLTAYQFANRQSESEKVAKGKTARYVCAKRKN